MIRSLSCRPLVRSKPVASVLVSENFCIGDILPACRVVPDVVFIDLGAANLISDKSVLTVAGSILTIEARHQSLLNLFAGAEPITQAFDIAMTPQQVLALIGGFISGCAPSDLGLVSNQALVAVESVLPIRFQNMFTMAYILLTQHSNAKQLVFCRISSRVR